MKRVSTLVGPARRGSQAWTLVRLFSDLLFAEMNTHNKAEIFCRRRIEKMEQEIEVQYRMSNQSSGGFPSSHTGSNEPEYAVSTELRGLTILTHRLQRARVCCKYRAPGAHHPHTPAPTSPSML